jgi:carbonic anhydrase
MAVIDVLIERNADFSAHHFPGELAINPTLKTMVIGCADPRVNPTRVLGLEVGEAAVIRNVGGRVTPATLKTMVMLGRVGQVNGGGPAGVGWNLVVLHHTDCGMTDLAAFPDLLAEYFEISKDQLEAKAVSDPIASVKIDVAVLKQTPFLPGGFLVSGLVYDVLTGRIETIVAPALLRPA